MLRLKEAAVLSAGNTQDSNIENAGADATTVETSAETWHSNFENTENQQEDGAAESGGKADEDRKN